MPSCGPSYLRCALVRHCLQGHIFPDYGKSGGSLLQFYEYMDSTPHELKPKVIILECVRNLNHTRKQLQQVTKGTKNIEDRLRELGYLGLWRNLCSTSFGLPQKRARVWGLFLKMPSFGSAGEQARRQDLSKALGIIKNCQVAQHESLTDLVGRVSDSRPLCTYPKQKPRKVKQQSMAWHSRHAGFVNNNKLTDTDLCADDIKEFHTVAQSVGLVPREVDAMSLRLALLRKKGQVPDWRETALMCNVGANVHILQPRALCSPCVCLGMKYLLLLNGKAYVDPPIFLALQGIGQDEVQAFGLGSLTEREQKDLAGNAFSANVCLAFLLAALVVL